MLITVITADWPALNIGGSSYHLSHLWETNPHTSTELNNHTDSHTSIKATNAAQGAECRVNCDTKWAANINTQTSAVMFAQSPQKCPMYAQNGMSGLVCLSLVNLYASWFPLLDYRWHDEVFRISHDIHEALLFTDMLLLVHYTGPYLSLYDHSPAVSVTDLKRIFRKNNYLQPCFMLLGWSPWVFAALAHSDIECVMKTPGSAACLSVLFQPKG